MLRATNVSKTLSGNTVLRDVEISVEPGKITVLIGPSGSGKTTLLRALALLDPPDSGVISLEEQTYRYPHASESYYAPPWPRLTAVFQQLFLWPHLTLRKNITLSLEHGRAKNNNMDRFEEIVQAFDMADFIDRYPNQASLGQRQRAAIARALVLEPMYLLLDEITSALDVEHVTRILNELRILRDRGIGVLLITHLLGFARTAADYVAFLDEGKIIESGGSEILDSPKTERVSNFVSVIQAAR